MSILKSYDAIVKAVGECSVQWAYLEWRVKWLVHTMSKTIAPEYADKRVSFPFEIMSGYSELRGNIAVAKVLAHTIDGDGPLYKEVCDLLNHIDNDLRPERNRYVHDHWLAVDGQGIMRLRDGAKITRPQSRETKMMRRIVKRYGDPEIVELNNQIEVARAKLEALDERIESLPPLKGLPSK